MRRAHRFLAVPGAALVLLLAACSGDATGGGGATSDGGAADPVGSTRGPALALDCPALFEAADPGAALGDGLEPTTVTGAGVGDYLGLAAAATAHAGGLACAWESSDAFVQLVVLPYATQSWSALASELKVFQPHEGRFGTSYDACMAGCRADVLVGDRWLSATISNATGEDAAWGIVERAVAAVEAAGEGAAVPAPAAQVDCAVLVPAALREAAMGAALTDDARFAPTQPVLLHGALVQLGGTHCFWMGDAGGDASVRVGLLPGGAAAWDAHWAVVPDAAVAPVDWQDAPDLGDAAKAGCYERAGCFVSVRAGDDWVSVTALRAAGDELAAAVRIAEGVLAARG